MHENFFCDPSSNAERCEPTVFTSQKRAQSYQVSDVFSSWQTLCRQEIYNHEPKKDSYKPVAWAARCEGKVWVWQMGPESHFCPLPLFTLQGVGRDLCPWELRIRVSHCSRTFVLHPAERHGHSNIKRSLNYESVWTDWESNLIFLALNRQADSWIFLQLLGTEIKNEKKKSKTLKYRGLGQVDFLNKK